MISFSKSGYRRFVPYHLVLFNARLWFLHDDQPFWRGDVDLTLDEPRLRKLAARLRRPFRVTPETYGHEWVAVVRPDGRFEIDPGWGSRARAGFIISRLDHAPRWTK